MHAAILAPLLGALGVFANITSQIDPVLAAVTASPPMNASQASVTFTNGARSLPGAYINFTEPSGLTSDNLTVVEVILAVPSNLSTTNKFKVFAYHVHEFPVAADDATCLSTGGHYDPFRANGTEGLVNATAGEPSPLYHPSPGNLSTYQLGDLSGKWGVLTTLDGSTPERTICDNRLRLTGNFTILGRSIVLHDTSTDTRIACGNITAASFSSASSCSSA